MSYLTYSSFDEIMGRETLFEMSCAVCESEIPARRLQALPGTTLCVECQAAHEEAHGIRLTAPVSRYVLANTGLTAVAVGLPQHEDWREGLKEIVDLSHHDGDGIW